MDHLEHPTEEEWEQRRAWFEDVVDGAQNRYASYLLSEHATALVAETQACFCAGAWVAVVVLAMSVIEAQLKEPGLEKKTANELIGAAELPDGFHQLRRRRNELVHGSHESDALSVDEQSSARGELRTSAEEAVRLMVRALFLNPGT